jgi:hypothetical protein
MRGLQGKVALYPSFETTWSSELPGVGRRAVPKEEEPVLLAQ